jgi:hypothetical protein
VFLELRTDDFLTDWLNFTLLHKAKDDVGAVSPDTSIVKGKSTNENGELKDEVSNDTETSDETEILEGRHISQETNKEGEGFTSGGSEDGWSNVFERESNSGFDIGDKFGNFSFSATNQEHIIDTNSQNQEGYHLSRDHGKLLVEVEG